MQKPTPDQMASTPLVAVKYNYPPELPVSGHRDEILAALSARQVVIVCGDTGSGKTTQLPKMAMEALLALDSRLQTSNLKPQTTPRRPRVACTQPRRLAAVTMAERVATELGTQVGGLVGYQHRYGRQLSSDTCIKFMTDGVLLAETRTDPLLRAYDVIIVDEAHERSLNIDFLLGILKRVLARRRDLKVIVSSATLDVEKFAAFFGQAPIVSVPGRLFPIDIRYRPPRADDELDLPRDIAAAITELPPGDDILVFLPGERDIRETADHLSKLYRQDEIIPLLASLPAAEQQRAFRLSARRRIILATNVAETSVTIPGIRCVIDSGLARISRFIHRTQVQRLQIEPVSQASARQRAGRCGRLGPGICIRLYSEEDFRARDEYTPPEVLRSSLAGVILSMLDLRLGDIERFPFLDPPRPAMIHEGLRELLELGAIGHRPISPSNSSNLKPQTSNAHTSPPSPDTRIFLTEVGRKLARLPVEPRLARMLLAAADNAVLPTALPIVAAMSCDDPRRRPVDEREQANQAHAQFRVPNSDFLGTLKLWTWWNDTTSSLSQSKSRALAKKNYLSYPKMREWRDLVRQLTDLCKRINLYFKETQGDDWSIRLHRSLLTGLLGRIGKYDEEEHEYRGAHGIRFALHPSSILTRKTRKDQGQVDTSVVNAHRRDPRKQPPAAPPWVMAGELVDTARLFARNAAVLDPSWLESAAGELCRHHYHSPEWDPQTGFVRATEQVTLYGLVIVPARRCDFSRVNLPFAREIFIRRGLVDGEFPHPPPEVRQNNSLLDALRQRAEKSRRPELFDAEKLCAHFAAILPPDVASAPALRKWLRSSNASDFLLKKSDWWPAENLDNADFPEVIRIGSAKMALVYRHTPDDPDEDGITCTVRKSDAAALRLWRSDWLVPGALPEKLAWMISTLPSALRRVLSPIDDTVSGLLAVLKPGSEPLADAFRHAIYEHWGFRVPADAWDQVRLPNHLQVRFRIRDDNTGRILACSRNLEEVLAQADVHSSSVPFYNLPSNPSNLKPQTSNLSNSSNPSSPSLWTFGTIPEKTADSKAGWKLEHFPALHDDGEQGVSLQLFPDAATAAATHAGGVTRLFLQALNRHGSIPFRHKQLSFGAQVYLKAMDYPDVRITADIFAGAVREALVRHQPPVRDAAEFERRLREQRGDLGAVQMETSRIIAAAFESAAKIDGELEAGRLPEETVDSVQTQLAWLLYRGFPRLVPLARLRHYARYLRGALIRLERARGNPAGDLSKEERLSPYWLLYQEAVAGRSKVKFKAAGLAEFRWMVEEYRVSLFAQELRTAEPVSPKRLDAKLAESVVD